MIEDEDLVKAIDRIARTGDGALQYRYLQKILMGVLPEGASRSALLRREGERSFAAKLMGLMAKGIDDSAGTSDSTSGASERPVVFLTRSAVAISRRESPRDYIARTDAEIAALRVSTDKA